MFNTRLLRLAAAEKFFRSTVLRADSCKIYNTKIREFCLTGVKRAITVYRIKTVSAYTNVQVNMLRR